MGERLLTQATGQGVIEVFASAEDRFFPKVMEAELVFTRGQNGQATAVTIQQSGNRLTGARVDK